MKDKGKIDTLNVIMCGHIDHGKTTLLHKLSGRWTDSHSEELKRGITIKLGYADIVISDDNGNYNREGKGIAKRYVSFIDAPGHEMLMATMLSGAAIVDAAILVVAANEGIKPQTREHLMALEAKKIREVVIVQNKIDLVTREQALKNYNDLKALVKGTVAEGAVIIPVSAQQEVNLEKIYEVLCNMKVPERNSEGDGFFVIARSFDINKPGTKPENLHGAVLGGAVKRGMFNVGDEIEIKPGIPVKENNQIVYKPLKTKIVKLFKGSEDIESMGPGGSVSIETELDMALGKNDALSGCVVSLAGKLPETTMNLKMKYSLFKQALGTGLQTAVEQIKMSEVLMISINTGVSVGAVKKLSKDEIELHLRIPIVPFKGDNVAIARNVNNHWRLIGYGEVL